MNTFSFKPAALASEVQYRIADDQIQKIASGKTTQIAIENIREIQYSNIHAKRFLMEKLDLITATETLSISLNRSMNDSADHPAYQSFIDTLLATLKAIEVTQPNVNIAMTEGKTMKWSMFAIGILSLAMPIAGVGIALATNVSSSKLWDGLLPMAMLVIIGVGLIRGFNPFTPVPTRDIHYFTQQYSLAKGRTHATTD